MNRLRMVSVRDNSIIEKNPDTLEMWDTDYGCATLWIENHGDDAWASFPLVPGQLRELSAWALASADELEKK